MVYKIESDQLDESILRVRNTFISKTNKNGETYFLRNIINKAKKGERFSGFYKDSYIYKNYQQSIAKANYVKNQENKQWAAHGKYIQREGAKLEGEKGLGFNKASDEIDISEELENWQNSGDELMWKVLVSPEKGDHLDLKNHIRLMMEKVEIDYGAKLEWAAIEHYNTENPHVHLVIRGRDGPGKVVRFNRDYIKKGFRVRTSEVATRQIGVRLKNDILLGREKAIRRDYMTLLDREILRMVDKDNKITFINKLPKNNYDTKKRIQIIGRLKYLEEIGFAKKTGVITWEISENLANGLKTIQLSKDIIKRQNYHLSNITENELPLVNTVLAKGEFKIGRVVGFGVHDDFNDEKYMLLEGIDGKIHYLQPKKTLTTFWDQARVKNGEVVILKGEPFKKSPDKYYIQINNYGNLNRIRKINKFTQLDARMIELIKANKLGKTHNTKTFRYKFNKLMEKRLQYFQSINAINRNYEINFKKLRSLKWLKKR